MTLHKNLGGRPAFAPSPSQRRIVRRALAEGRSLSEIARALGLHRNTARKLFAAEISDAECNRAAVIIETMHTAAVGGSVPAQKAFVRACERWEESGRRLSIENVRKLASVIVALYHAGVAGSVPAMTEYLRRNRLGEEREQRNRRRAR